MDLMNLFGKSKPSTSEVADKVRNGDKADGKNRAAYTEYATAKAEAGEKPVSYADWVAGKK
jgi:hypothetical protein